MKMLCMKLALVSFVLPMGACCAQDEPLVEPRKDLMPFSVSFTLDGKPVLLDSSGKPIEPTKLEYPLHSTAIERIDSIVMVQAQGSHYKAVVINGVEYQIKLKH